ncbi:MAG: hypothetical protein KDD33_08500 [Bdellovibrionales bacterium]|nr:hypothetical protein [Bdellovibrionales bacterium]
MQTKSLLSLVLVALFGFNAQAEISSKSCFKYHKDVESFEWDERRGSPADFDPGPASEESKSWLKLYGQLPNYRNIGDAILGGSEEKFRWIMGPMWYRGRLGKNQVKIFVVGQEGAQDENLTNRAFTGSTGTKTQNFLNHLGVYQSYLFMNTFVYTINGQLDAEDPAFKEMEQGLTSPIVQYRHQLFDNVIKMNPESVALFIGVGAGGKASLATWINTRSGAKVCSDNNDLGNCDTSKLVEYFASAAGGRVLSGNEKILAIGVPHPGSLAFGGTGDMLKSTFSRAARRVAKFMEQNPGWLPADPQETSFAKCMGGERVKRMNGDYEYDNSPVPFRDFSFNTNWRMGSQGTASNRMGSQRIQIFSSQGRYGNIVPLRTDIPLGPYKTNSGRSLVNDTPPEYDYYKVPSEAYAQLKDEDKGLLWGMKDIEVPYEPPRWAPYGYQVGDYDHASQFDPGPSSAAMAKALTAWPDFQEIDASAYISHESFGFAGSYRGNTENPKVVIIADQMGHTDMFSTRALTGEGGQWLQAFLDKTGLTEDNAYLIVRALPVDTLGVSTKAAIQLAISKDSQGKSAAKTIAGVLKQIGNPVKLVTLGPVADAIAKDLGVDAVSMKLPKTSGYKANWVAAAKALQLNVPSESDLDAMYLIPRKDLPYSTRWWMGSTGELGQRGYGESAYNKQEGKDPNYLGHYYRVVAPSWVTKLKREDPRELTDVEKGQVKEVLEAVK